MGLVDIERWYIVVFATSMRTEQQYESSRAQAVTLGKQQVYAARLHSFHNTVG